MKIFGKELFNFATQKMYDFAKHGIIGVEDREYGFIAIQAPADASTPTVKPKKLKKGDQKVVFTPKGLYQCGALNQNEFKIATDPTYLQEQIKIAKQKLALLPKNKKATWGPTSYAIDELESIIERLGNRTKLGKHTALIEQYPHTTNELINRILKQNDNLRFKTANDFVPDFPVEAVQAMKEYNDMCKALCGKYTHFYVIADKKDFGEVSKRRDPILLAQSPFGFFWQILGAWDEEMIYLGDL